MEDAQECYECDSLRSEIRNLEDELHHLEGKVSNLEGELELKGIECDQVTANLAELSEYVQELETALAEAHLMSAPTEGPTGKVGDPQ